MNSWQMAMVGGALIGVAALTMMALLGRIAGISGIISGTLPPFNQTNNLGWKLCFLGGLVIGTVLYHTLSGQPFPSPPSGSTTTAIIAGLLVGFGTRLGSGCTSGHGVCGMARLSPRSIIATLIFCSSGIATVVAIKLIL